MRLFWKLAASSAIFLLPVMSRAVTCTSQGEMAPADRSALAGLATQFAQSILSQNYSILQTDLLPAEAAQWSGIQSAAQNAHDVMQGGQFKLENAYLLDATSLTAPADTEFFCSNASGSLTVSMSMPQLPPGKYAIILGESSGAPLGGQLGIVLALDNAPPAGWKLAGISAHQGKFDGHDGVWFWTRARALANADPWSAWYCYDLARYALLPVSFISSPNLQKLNSEQAAINNSPKSAFPYSVPDGARTWKINSITLDTVLHQADLAVIYESTGVSTPAAQHTEAVAVLSALLKAQPGLRENFHGLWAVADVNGKQNPIIELPMAQIPKASGQ